MDEISTDATTSPADAAATAADAATTIDLTEVLEHLGRIEDYLQNIQVLASDIISVFTDSTMFGIGIFVGGLMIKTLVEVGSRW